MITPYYSRQQKQKVRGKPDGRRMQEGEDDSFLQMNLDKRRDQMSSAERLGGGGGCRTYE
jgi:hypothetical protein